MTEAMPFLQKYDITFLRPPTIIPRAFFAGLDLMGAKKKKTRKACLFFWR